MPCTRPPTTGVCSRPSTSSCALPKVPVALAPIEDIFIVAKDGGFTITWATDTSYPDQIVVVKFRGESDTEFSSASVARDTGIIDISGAGVVGHKELVLVRAEGDTTYGGWDFSGYILLEGGWLSEVTTPDIISVVATPEGFTVIWNTDTSYPDQIVKVWCVVGDEGDFDTQEFTAPRDDGTLAAVVTGVGIQFNCTIRASSPHTNSDTDEFLIYRAVEPNVINSIIHQDVHYDIVVMFDQPMSATAELKDNIELTLDGVVTPVLSAAIIGTENKFMTIGVEERFDPGDVATWQYNSLPGDIFLYTDNNIEAQKTVNLVDNKIEFSFDQLITSAGENFITSEGQNFKVKPW